MEKLKEFIDKYSKEYPEEDFSKLKEFIDNIPAYEELIQMEKYLRRQDILVLSDKIKSLDPELSKLIDKYFWDLI